MQEQSQAKFLASPTTLESMPFLGNLFESIDKLITECAEVNNTDLTQLKRFVAGHVSRDDLKEVVGKFSTLEKKQLSYNDWNALMGITLAQRKRPRIDKEAVACANQLRIELYGDDQGRADELRAEVEAKKEELKKNKEERMMKMKAAADEQHTPVRLIQYHNDIDKLLKNTTYMYENYGTHIILAAANEDPSKYDSHPSFASGNTELAAVAIAALNDKLGFPLYYEMQTRFARKDDISMILEGRDRAFLVKTLRKFALESLKRSDPKVGKKIEWKNFFDVNDPYGKVDNWPVTDDYKPQYYKDGKINLKAFSEEQLIFLITAIKKKEIVFSK